jgi:hypothetical protein
MNLTRRQQMLKNLKIQIIKTLALNQKVRCHFMKRGDNVSKGDNHQSDFLFSFFINKFQFFLVSRMNVEKGFVEKLQRKYRKKLDKLKEE